MAAMGQDAEVNQGESDRFIEQWIGYCIMVSYRFSRKKQTTVTVIVQ
jgi:hypothetical protein